MVLSVKIFIFKSVHTVFGYLWYDDAIYYWIHKPPASCFLFTATWLRSVAAVIHYVNHRVCVCVGGGGG